MTQVIWADMQNLIGFTCRTKKTAVQFRISGIACSITKCNGSGAITIIMPDNNSTHDNSTSTKA